VFVGCIPEKTRGWCLMASFMGKGPKKPRLIAEPPQDIKGGQIRSDIR
jgi:hypothetical protein